MKKNFVLKIPVLLMLIFSSLYAVDYTETRIWANDAAGSDYFGHAVAGDNYRVVVGAWGEDDQGNSTGAVYLYEKDGNLWEQTNRFKPGDGNGYEAFGKAVDIESNTIIVGAPDDIDPTTSGAAYVYEYISGGWEPTKLTPPDGANGDSFGSSVSVSGEYIAIGASKHDLPDFKGAGVVYIYKKGVSSWDHEATISLTGVGAGPYADDNFGSCVSLDGNRIAIGAHKRNGPENTVQDVGAVFIFVREGTTWSLEKRLDPPQAVANAWFGKSVALDGDDIAVGSPTNSATTAGDVYAFSYNGTNWVLDATLVPGDLTGDNWWGSSVALYNNTLVGGQYLDGDHGAVYVYQKSGEVWGAPQKITPVEAQAAGDDKFGYAVALNGADVIVGAEDGFAKEGGASVNLAGAAYIYTAPQTLEPLAADFQASVTSGNLPLTVNFTDLSTGSPTTWKWNFGDSTTSEVQSPSHIYNKPGIFNVTLQISDGTATNSITKTGYISVHVTQPGNNVWTSYSNALMFGQPNQFAVRSMCYDPFTDHLLVGTTGGVAEFSGVYWSSYAVSEDIDHQEVLAVAVDSSGNKWFGLENGVQVYRESDSTFYNPTGGQVNDIFVQSNGSIWLATSTGLATFDGATWTVYTAENSDLPGNNLTRITMDPSHTTFIVSSQDGGIYVFEKGVWQVYDTEDGLTDNTVYDVVLDWNYNAWIAPETGSIVRLNRDDVTTYEPMGDNESERQYTSVGVDSLGNVWASSANAGVARFDGVAWTHYDEEGSDLSSDLVRCKDILVDPNGVVWFGTEDAGVCRFGPTVAPAIDFYADVITGFAPLTVNFFGVAAGGTPTYWLWDFDNDGETDILNDQNPSWTFDVPGYYSVKLFAPMGDENYQEIKTNYIHVLESIQNSASLSGKVTDATTGYPVAGATVTLGDSTKITDSEGNYAFINMPISDLVADFTGLPRSGEAPLTVQFTDLSAQGRLYLTAAKTGYINYSTFVTLPQGNTTMDISLSPTIAEGGMRVVLNWGQTPYDLDIYLKTPEIEGSFYQVYYSNKGSATIAPYANLDVDDRSGYGPETITIHDLFSGVYRCYIHNYSGTPALTQSAGVVQIYNDTGLLETVNVPLSGEGRYWYIGDIDGATGNVTIYNTIQESAPGSSASSPLTLPAKEPLDRIDASPVAVTTWAWDFDNDGDVDATTQNPQYTYTEPGVYSVKLTVSDGEQQDTKTRTEYITVGTGQTFGSLSGKVTNAITGIGIEGAIVTVAGYADTTDEAGNYSFTHIPSGLLNVDFSGDPRSGNTPLTVQFTDLSTSALQLVSASAEGYYSYSQYVMVLYAGSTLNISLSPVLDEGNMRVVLTWNTTPADMDIHLYTPAIGGKTYQVYYSNKGDSDDAPYAVLDIDDRNGTGPETITIYELQEGTYKCYVHNYSGTPGITASSGLVQIFNTSGLVEAINVPTTGEGQYWYVCDINGATGAVTVVNTLQTSMGSSLSSNKLAAKSYLPEEMTDGFAEASETITTWAWDFNNDGTVDATTKNPQYTYTSAGVYDVKLTVSDGTQTRSLVKQEYITVTEEDTVEYGNLSGQVVNAITGVGIEGAIVTIAGYTTTTNSSGYYVFEHIPVGTLTANFAASPVSGYAPLTVYFADYSSAGAQLINVSATGYYGYNRYVSISPAGTVLNISLSPVIENGDMRIVLTWNTTPADMDLHLFTPAIGGKTYQVYYSNKGSENSAPYAELDIDDRNGTGPETITLYDLQEGTYKCYVHNYSGTPGITTSEGLIQIFNTSGLVEAISVPTGGEGQYWYVCDINGTTGAVTVVNTLQSSMNSALAGLQPSLGKNNLLPEKPAYVESVESAQSTSAVVSWQWDFNNDGDIDATTQNPLFIYNEPGVYTVSLTVSDGTNTDKETKYNYITVTENTELEGYIVSINAIDYDNFPTVKLYSSVMNDNTLLPVNGLLSTAFSLAEDGATSTITNITQVTTTDKLPLDITFVVDIEDNMTAHLAKLKAYAPVLTDSLALLGLDCRYGLVTFRDMVASINDLTADAAHFTSMLNDIPLPLASENNSYNNLLEALARAAQFSYRENAMRMVIVLTDTTYYNNDITHTTYTPAVIGNMLLNNGITTLMICTDNDQLKTLGNEANAGRFDITEDLTGTLRKLVKIMGSQYIITYTSPHPTPTDYWRYVLLTVNANDMGGYDAAQYKVGSTRIVLGSGTIPGIVNTYFTLDIYAQSVINLKQCLIDVGYDATALEYVSGTIGSFLGTDITDLTAPGTNKVIINLNRTATTGVSGTGVLYSLRFKILKATSTSPFTFNQVTLQDPSGTNITYTTETPELESPYVDDGTGNLVSRLRGDFNNDSYISLVDLAMLSTYWGIADSIKGDIGPAYGDLPFLTTLNDNLVNEQDLFIFALMWNWYHQNLSYISGGLSKSNSVITWLPSADNQTSKTVEVNLQISEVRNMNMGHVQFSYDPAVLQFKTVQAGEFWIKDKASVALFVDNDDKAGVVNIAFARLADREMNAEAAGSGALFTAEFERINLTAASILELRNLDLRNSANKTMLKTSGASISIDGMTLPKAFALSQNYPNPFNSTTTLQFSMPKEENVTIEVFNILGQPVRTLIDTRFEPGVHKVMWNGKNDQDMDVVSGIYFVRMKSASFKQVKQILLLK